MYPFKDSCNRPVPDHDPRPLLDLAQGVGYIVGYCNRVTCEWRTSSRPTAALNPNIKLLRCGRCHAKLRHLSLSNVPVF